ncbi:hypothetical protein GW17_00021608 [Ensete ventricosum]|nr:hypothetical protein GW17_00021608 [Ensete ventricosum]
MLALVVDADVMPLLAAHLLDHHHSSMLRPKRECHCCPPRSFYLRRARCSCAPRASSSSPFRCSLAPGASLSSIIGSEKLLIVALMDLPVALDMPTRSIKDVLKALFGLGLYLLDRIIVVELSVVPPLFALVVKDERRGVVEDAR